jgi:hypothetical protein
MKKVLTIFAALSFVLSLALTADVDAQGPKGKGMGNGNCKNTEKKCCANFVDENKDGKCDKFVDANNDGKCDNCTAEGKCEGSCKGKGMGMGKGNCSTEKKNCDNATTKGCGHHKENCTGSGACGTTCKGKDYVDANNDGKCDNFVDANNDGKCDKAASCCNNMTQKGNGCKKHKGCDNNTNTNTNTKVDVGNPYPNPFDNNTTLNYELKEAGMVNVSVFDANGNLVKTIFEGQQSAGSQTAQFDGSGLQTGSYSFVVKYNGTVVTKQAIHIK